MPEGDTLYRVAERLRAVLAGEVVVAFRSPLPALRDVDLEGHRIESVVARGKNLLIRFDDGRTLHTHLRMNGRWVVKKRLEHLEKKGLEVSGVASSDRLRGVSPSRLRGTSPNPFSRGALNASANEARVVIETNDHVALCFAAPVVRLLTAAGLRRDRMLGGLGPDLLGEEFDENEALDRLQSLSSVPIAEAIMDQRATAGIGNVYKSELLFLGGLDPFALVSAFTREELRALLANARDLMKKNLKGGPRTTRFGARERLWVYDRTKRPCFRCRTAISMKHQGLSRRSVYWCPGCQPRR